MRVKLLAAGLALLAGIAVLAMGPALAETANNDALTIDVEQAEDGTATVTLTENDTAVSNASVSVAATDNDTYAGDGAYVTDVNGTVDLPEPNETVDLTVEATTAEHTAVTNVTLHPGGTGDDLAIGVQQGAGAVTVSVSSAGEPVRNATVSVDAAGLNVSDQETDEAGSTSFDRPNETVNATITATTAGASASTTETIQGSAGNGPDHTPPGQMVSSYVQTLQDADLEGPLGSLVSAFSITANTGPPAHVTDNATTGPPDHAGNESEGPPEHANGEQGPPEHAGPDEDDDDNGNGPPAHAGPPGEEDDE